MRHRRHPIALIVATLTYAGCLGSGPPSTVTPSTGGASSSPSRTRAADLEAIPGFVAAIELGAGLPWRVGATDDSILIIQRDPAARASSIVAIDPGSDTVRGEPVELGFDAWGFTTGNGAAWVAENGQDARVMRIDASALQPDEPMTFEGRWPGAELAVAFDSLWTADSDLRDDGGHTVTRIDPATRKIAATIDVGASPQAITAGSDLIWAANHDSEDISTVDPGTNDEQRRYPLGKSVHELLVVDGRLWLSGMHEPTVAVMEPETGSVTEVELPFEAYALGFADDVGLWVAAGGVGDAPLDGRIARVDPTTMTVGPIHDLGAQTMDLVAAFGAIWVLTRDPDLLVRIDV